MHREGPRRSPRSQFRPRRRPSPASYDALHSLCRSHHSLGVLYGLRARLGSRMSRRFKTIPPLMDEQALAADPSAHASLSASAGTGKTQVLTARVLRLLLKGARPESILCLTFTKAAAAEMANRIGAR